MFSPYKREGGDNVKALWQNLLCVPKKFLMSFSGNKTKILKSERSEGLSTVKLKSFSWSQMCKNCKLSSTAAGNTQIY